MFDISRFETSLKKAFKQINKAQSATLSIQIAANFIAGMAAADKQKSFKSVDPEPIDPEEEGLTNDEKVEIALLLALFLGYSNAFNEKAQAHILGNVKEMVQAGVGTEEIKKYVDDVFLGKESITIDNVGKTKKEIYVDKELKLSEVSKVIEKPYSTTLLSYAAMLGATIAHTAYEKGRKAQYTSQALNQWVFVGPADEIARPHHIALIGEVFTWNTDQSSYAEHVLQEPRCRHRSQVYYGDSRDTKKEVWDKLKKDSGIFWNDDLNKWDID